MSHDLFFQAANARALGRDVPEVWSVSQVNALARELLEGSIPLLRVAGEVSGFKRYRQGHCYFTLKDERAQLNCVMWAEAARRLPAEPPEGMAVHVFGQPSVFVRAGRLQFVVRELEAQGEGLWRLAFERIRHKLASEGLFDPKRKRPLPRTPAGVGIVTSLEGAVLRDIVAVIRRRAPWTDVAVYPTRVQGDGAAGAIAAAIRRACRSSFIQVLIVGRGGGSREDLWAFNDERVARAIAASPIPVISAVGHEIDVSIADLVADRRAATPSAAAEMAVPDRSQLGSQLAAFEGRLESAVRSLIRDRSRAADALAGGLKEALSRVVDSRRRRLEMLAHKLDALGPMSVLERGYSVALDDDGKTLRSTGDFKFPMDFVLRLRDGRIRARAESKTRSE